MANVHAQHEEPNYMNIFWTLAVLTVIEVGVVYVPASRLLIGFLLVALACTKATLVAMYFMHLKFERSTLGIIALTPMLICVFLIFMLLPDLTAHNKLHTPAVKTVAGEHAATH
ncbi:MAG: cytochrome C oxidase subunit IV family protein [Deltaproteobacteria bacterium]|nr:cytochrome C oxidase subunit IV family protein [Deltaproteobacteria bacterium]